MPNATFAYKHVKHTANGEIIRPLITIQIAKGNAVLRQEVLLDTGADLCVFSGRVATLLRIKLEEGIPYHIRGVGNTTIPGYIHKIGLIVPGFPTRNTWAFFSGSLSHMSIGILGQRGFFENFEVNFKHRKRSIEING